MQSCSKGHEEYADDLKLCPTCKKEYRKAYYEKNKEKERAKTLEWINNNREIYLAAKKERRTPESDRLYYANRLAKRKYDNVWRGMHDRCYDVNHHKYPTYGARGITVFPEWHGEDGYFRFEAYIGARPTPLHSIDRINNDGNYEPGNVRWASKKEQQRNRHVNNEVTINGRTQCVSAWAEEIGVRRSTFQRRLDLRWTEDRLLQPADQKFNRMAKNGVSA